MRSSGRRAARESVAVGPGLSVFPVGRARGSAGTRRAGGAREGGRRRAMGGCRVREGALLYKLGVNASSTCYRVAVGRTVGEDTGQTGVSGKVK